MPPPNITEIAEYPQKRWKLCKGQNIPMQHYSILPEVGQCTIECQYGVNIAHFVLYFLLWMMICHRAITSIKPKRHNILLAFQYPFVFITCQEIKLVYYLRPINHQFSAQILILQFLAMFCFLLRSNWTLFALSNGIHNYKEHFYHFRKETQEDFLQGCLKWPTVYQRCFKC